MKKLSILFGALAVLLSDVMCAVVTYTYRDLTWGCRYAGYGTPAGAAFVYAVPYGAAIAVCVVLAVVLGKRAALPVKA